MPVQRLQDFGPYRIVKALATGGMAEIYLARQRAMEGVERTVVIKRILEARADDAEFVTMFLDEARLLAALSHPNIAQVFDLGRVDGTYYLAMEHVRGPTLGAVLALAKRKGDGRLPRREALGIALAIAEALHYVHERRDDVGRSLAIVHRDLNPANVLLSFDGAVKLIDFGIAKAATKVYETRAGVIKGTYGYIAPEQLTGTTPVDRRADVFALGILLYEMCVGEHPYDVSDEPNLVDRILSARYRKPREVRPDIPRDLDKLISRCLTPHPVGRPDDMHEVIESLVAHLGSQGQVPTQTALAAVVRSLVADDEGPAPLRPMTSPARPRPFDRDHTMTRRVGLAEVGHHAPSLDAPTAFVSVPLEARDVFTGENTHLADDEPLTLAGEHRRGGDAVDDDPPTIAREMPSAAGGLEDDAKTRVVSLPGPLRPVSVPRTPPREARVAVRSPAASRLPRFLVLGGAGLGIVALSIVALLGARWLAADEPGEVTAAAAGSEIAAEPGLAPVQLHVESEPPGATVYVDGVVARGLTPLEVTLPPETRRVWLRLEKAGFLEEEREVNATVGGARFVLEPLALDAGRRPVDEAAEPVTAPPEEPP